MQAAQTDTRASARRNLLRDFALYLGISVAAVSAILWAILSDVPKDTVLGWFLFGSFAVFLVGDLVWKSRSVWKDRVFWCGVVFFLVANFFVFRRFLWGGAVNGLELAALFGVEGVIFRAFRSWREDAVKTGSAYTPQP